MTAAGLGCAKTKSDLVVMSSAGRIFAFFCCEPDHEPQNSGCSHTAQRFHTARVNSLHYRAAAFLSASPQLAESIRAAKRFRVVPKPDSCSAAKSPQISMMKHSPETCRQG